MCCVGWGAPTPYVSPAPFHLWILKGSLGHQTLRAEPGHKTSPVQHPILLSAQCPGPLSQRPRGGCHEAGLLSSPVQQFSPRRSLKTRAALRTPCAGHPLLPDLRTPSMSDLYGEGSWEHSTLDRFRASPDDPLSTLSDMPGCHCSASFFF